MMDIFDDIQTDRPDGGDTLTMEKLDAALAKLRSGGYLAPGTMVSWSGSWHSTAPLVVADPGQLEAAGFVPIAALRVTS